MNFILTVPLADTWGMHGDDVGAGWMILMMLLMVLFWAAIILGIVWLVRGGFERSRADRARAPERPETPSEILERRFAEGAISVEDYQQRRELIGTGATRGRAASGEGD